MEEGNHNPDLFVIVNPHAGLGKGRKDWPVISALFKKAGIAIVPEFTKEKLHAKELAMLAIESGYRKLIAVGGDGTLNEIVNGIIEQQFCPSTDVILGMIPIGSGNDWRRMYNIPDDHEGAVEVIRRSNYFIQDAGKITFLKNEKYQHRYFANIAGIGFDAVVVNKTNRQKDKNKGGKFLYLYNLLTSLFSSVYSNAEILIDGKKINSSVFSMNVGICKYSGGGMMQVPGAIPDDGLFDITLIRKIGKLEVLRNIKNLYDGSFIKNPKVSTFRANHISVNTDPAVYVEVDGESLGSSPLEFEVIPVCLRIITGN
jgi:YegS/Rv2252/BmrU family lipid kinase